MKVKILFVLFFFGLNQLNAQSLEKASIFKQPKGFVYIPQQGVNPAFYVMEEPVTILGFNEYLKTLYSQNNIIDVNTCKLATPNDHYNPTKYLILSDPKPIELYAKYISDKLSDSTYIVKCFPISEKMWKQMKAPVNLKDSKGKNPYGLIFFPETEEYKINAKGEYLKISVNQGYQRGTFRLALTYIQRKTPTKK